MPFIGLHVKVRPQVVADALAEPLDWADCGKELAPAEWHHAIKETSEQGDDRVKTVVVDCR